MRLRNVRKKARDLVGLNAIVGIVERFWWLEWRCVVDYENRRVEIVVIRWSGEEIVLLVWVMKGKRLHRNRDVVYL